MTALRPLQRFVRRGPPAVEGTRCELCAASLGEPHPHVLERSSRQLRCACGACAVLFRDPAENGRWRTVPDRVAHDPSLAIADAEWAALGVPVRAACVTRRRDGGREAWSALFPSPAGPVDGELPAPPWAALARRSALVASLAWDVEALLVRRGAAGSAGDLLVAPIDRGFALVALVRRTWSGFSGGDDAWRAIDDFFSALRAASRPCPAATKGGDR